MYMRFLICYICDNRCTKVLYKKATVNINLYYNLDFIPSLTDN